jgi:Domain of unknown function (DUF4258)
MVDRRFIYRVHAVQRMFERGVSTGDVRRVLADGEVIEEYPSRLMLAFVNSRPLHVVAADNPLGDETYVITVYEPDLDQWDATFRMRK